MQIINKSISVLNPRGRSFYIGKELGKNGFFHPFDIIEVPEEIGHMLISSFPGEVEALDAPKLRAKEKHSKEE